MLQLHFTTTRPRRKKEKRKKGRKKERKNRMEQKERKKEKKARKKSKKEGKPKRAAFIGSQAPISMRTKKHTSYGVWGGGTSEKCGRLS